MENASKALLMAASILIGILIISLAVYLFATFGAEAQQVNERNKTQQLRQFNEQFTIYEEQSGNVTIYDVITAANVAKDNNAYYGFSNRTEIINTDNYITVDLNINSVPSGCTPGSKHLENKDSDYYNKLINSYNSGSNKKTFSCKAHISTITGRVYHVEFEE